METCQTQLNHFPFAVFFDLCISLTHCSLSHNDIDPAHVTHTHKAAAGNEVHQHMRRYKVPGFQLISLPRRSCFLFEVGGREGVVHCDCPRLCQIKGQRLDGEAILLFIRLQLRERPNKSGGNVVTGESERSLPMDRKKCTDSLIKASKLWVFFPFPPKCHFHTRVSWPVSFLSLEA